MWDNRVLYLLNVSTVICPNMIERAFMIITEQKGRKSTTIYSKMLFAIIGMR